ncbi:flagellar biosynthesis protein FlhF [Candidatus Phycosocius bacilliformis]|uniref:Flagellar biosynthesis protein FlhF n=1 Tax=Candidatus Phycosocius bacilliformis TaxID=1445552 RepID=A0A2P2EC31_9PROT|nr:hypothetical protein [Candidatus Phycosocius bacilliformis]GBF58628.1 flagellar biosynthesis protein FlhF [Candidatus Phycosocius bacilliformis]
MRVHTFFAPTLPEAIAQVRSELGPKAVVLSWRNTRGGIEISASTEGKVRPKAALPQSPADKNPRPDRPAQGETLAQHFKPEDFLTEPAPKPVRDPTPQAQTPPPAASPTAQKSAPISGRGAAALLGRQGVPARAPAAPVAAEPKRAEGAPTKSVNRPAPVAAQPSATKIAGKPAPAKASLPQQAPLPPKAEPAPEIVAPSRLALFLARAGLSREQAMAMAVSDHPQLRHGLAETFAEKLTFDPIEAAPMRPLVLVGPPGAGKTAAVAKLAARALAVGAETLLISVDSERCGGAEQLAAMATRLGTGFETATTMQDLSRLTKQARQAGHCVLVDAAAASPMQPADMRATARLIDDVGLEPILCIPADMRFEDMSDLVQGFATLGTRRAIATRFDLTPRRASVLYALHLADMALAQISATPFITGGIAIASAHRVAALLMEPFDDLSDGTAA